MSRTCRSTSLPSAARESAQCPEPPGQFSVRGNLQKRNTRGCSPIWPRHAAGIQESHAVENFISRDVGVPMENDFCVVGLFVRRNVDEMEPNSVSFQVARERP